MGCLGLARRPSVSALQNNLAHNRQLRLYQSAFHLQTLRHVHADNPMVVRLVLRLHSRLKKVYLSLVLYYLGSKFDNFSLHNYGFGPHMDWNSGSERQKSLDVVESLLIHVDNDFLVELYYINCFLEFYVANRRMENTVWRQKMATSKIALRPYHSFIFQFNRLVFEWHCLWKTSFIKLNASSGDIWLLEFGYCWGYRKSYLSWFGF